MAYELYDYQQDAIEKTNAKLKTDRFALIHLAGGLGKSVIMAELARQYNRVVLLQPCLELVLQNFEKLKVLESNITMIDSKHKGNWDAEYIYTTPQTLSNNLGKCQEPDLLVIDEAHIFFGGKKLFNTIWGVWNTCKVVALTATPFWYDTRAQYSGGWVWSVSTIRSIADDLFGQPVISIGRKEAKEKYGRGANIQIKKAPICKCYTEHFENLPVYQPLVRQHLTELFAFLKPLDNGIIYCDSIFVAETISKLTGIPCIFGKTGKTERAEIIEKFKAGQIRFVLTVGCLGLGFDYPGLKNIVVLANQNNECAVEQLIVRLNRGKGCKTAWYNSAFNTDEPVLGKQTRVRVKRIGYK
jgi:DNA repair protein RadD